MKRKVILMVMLFCLVAVCQTYGGIVAHYSFDDAGDLGVDSSGNGHNLADFDNAPAYTSAGKVGGAASFDGSTQGYQVQNYIFPEGDFSFALWVKPDEVSPLVIRSHGTSSGFAITMVSSEYRFWTYHTSGIGDSWLGSGSSPVLGEWQHLAMTFDPTSGPDATTGNYIGTMKIYVDGVLVNTKTDAEYDAESWNDLDIGRRSTEYFDGSMDELVIYDHTLTANEISVLVPEPATLAMLSVGSLVALRRKK